MSALSIRLPPALVALRSPCPRPAVKYNDIEKARAQYKEQEPTLTLVTAQTLQSIAHSVSQGDAGLRTVMGMKASAGNGGGGVGGLGAKLDVLFGECVS